MYNFYPWMLHKKNIFSFLYKHGVTEKEIYHKTLDLNELYAYYKPEKLFSIQTYFAQRVKYI